MTDKSKSAYKEFRVHPNMDYDADLNQAILIKSKGQPFFRNLTNDERIMIMKEHQCPQTPIFIQTPYEPR
jgi:hypothetical protein